MKVRREIVWAALIALTLCMTSGQALAQEAAEHGHGKSWLDLFKTTGAVGYLMLACSIVGTTLVIEHLVTIRRDKMAPEALAADLQALIDEGEYDEAIALCDEANSYLGNLVGAALRTREAGYEEMIATLDAAANEEAFNLNTKISYLSLIGNIAPLLGLLGTVTGMISSFQVIETLKAPTPGDLAKGVYESLVNTTLGLFLAIVFLTIYFFFKNKVSRIALSIHLQAVGLVQHFSIQKRHAA